MLLGKGVRKIPGSIASVFGLKQNERRNATYFINFDDLGKKF